MNSRLNEVDIEEISAEEAFAILGNGVRMEILRTLWESDAPRSFAELRRSLSYDDNGNLSYHLKRLTGHFVRKTDDGYSLRFAGERVVRAAITGTITSDPTIEPEETAERCVYCGAAVEMAYDEEIISVRCTECGGVVGREFPDGAYMHYEFPPAGLIDRTRETAIDAAHVLYDSKIAPMMKGVCPECAGPVSVSHEICDDHEVGESGLCPRCGTRYEVWSHYECEYCQYSRRSALWFAALNHPAVVAFLYEHGLEEKIPMRKLTWDSAAFVREVTGTAIETDPPRFRVVVPVGEERLVVRMNEDLDVVSVTPGSE